MPPKQEPPSASQMTTPEAKPPEEKPPEEKPPKQQKKRTGPCMVPSVSADCDDPLAPAFSSIKLPDASTFTPFIFIADESATFMSRKDGNVETSLLVRLFLPSGENETTLGARYEPMVGPVVTFDSDKIGSRWKLTAIGLDKFVMESVQFRNTCLEARKYRLNLRVMTSRDWDRIHHGVWDEDATCTIMTKPDFAVKEVGVVVR
ncbi:uncharacterized protein LOC112560617 isoform X4 [Pomacea canaliculata]|uniref:uncharacterized protein LOC112560617 isoform X4 n=1 Tax=Pomacea canaliculata TaxID=400727 RepID=UPI000D739BEA|nr:uncharacterized protein LOC112560617 isoform X4 [Pomacea canaliculata]